jgi:hypothetical protein
MPRIELIPEVLHQAMDPYHHEFDNLPLQNILTRQSLLNSAVDINSDILRDSVGTQGTLSNRLTQSIEDNGDLKLIAVDDVMHNIAYHTDGTILISSIPVSFVRMKEEERDKLTLIDDEATSIKIQVETISTTVLFDDETVRVVDSDTVTWSVTSPNIIKANLTFPVGAAHTHYYDYTPVHANLVTPDYTNYKVTSVATPFVDGSLRVTINGIRINKTESVYVPGSTGPSSTWTLTEIDTSVPASGTFALNRAITDDDVIRIDFDTDFS